MMIGTKSMPEAVTPSPSNRDNAWVAGRLREAASLLALQEANAFRVSAYRRAADVIETMGKDLRTIVEVGGHVALEDIAGVGPSIAGAISEMLSTGRWSFLDRLEGGAEPEALFSSIPGVGPHLAGKIHESLHAETLEELEIAANDGRLERVPSIGARRAAMIRTGLASMLARTRPSSARIDEEPAVPLLIDVDQEYRTKATQGTLPTIAPKRFNPGGEAWLPILHTQRGGWHFTALYSNTVRAHQFGRTGDWVVIFFHRDGTPEGRRTVVTETQGPARGQRVVRGRERESRTARAWPLSIYSRVIVGASALEYGG